MPGPPWTRTRVRVIPLRPVSGYLASVAASLLPLKEIAAHISPRNEVGMFAFQFLEVEHLNQFLEELNPIMEEAGNLFPAAPEKPKS